MVLSTIPGVLPSLSVKPLKWPSRPHLSRCQEDAALMAVENGHHAEHVNLGHCLQQGLAQLLRLPLHRWPVVHQLFQNHFVGV